jgi:hypothetical protein
VLDKLFSFVEAVQETAPGDLSPRLRLLAKNWRVSSAPWAAELCPIALVLADLVDQGWALKPSAGAIEFMPPGLQIAGEDIADAKARIRRALLVGQQRQLRDPAVVRFLRRVEKVQMRNDRRGSISCIIDSGYRLYEAIQRATAPSNGSNPDLLRDVIDPEVVPCDADERCPVTGIRLLDIWRYFRHTWSLEYRSIPGRKLPLLIRNKAHPTLPIIGIAMLASPVIRSATREDWIGWSYGSFVARLMEGSWDVGLALRALRSRIDQSIAEVRWDDLMSADEVNQPSERTEFRLLQRAAGAAATRISILKEEYEKELSSRKDVRVSEVDWMVASKEPLFIRKRAETLVSLVAAKRTFAEINWSTSPNGALEALLAHPKGPSAIATALREHRKAGLASQIADVSVCGAVEPYNVLLGGKLVTMLMTSLEARSAYKERYSDAISIISSQMAGRSITRPADLKVLTTTSLYGVASSQYNRLKFTTRRFPELAVDLIWEERKELTRGYGTVHLAPATVQALRELSRTDRGASTVNHKFGEGASPRLRQVREGLMALGIDSNDILHHDTPRLFFGCRLRSSAFEELLGLGSHHHQIGNSAANIAVVWRRRWLSQRVSQVDVLEKLRALGPHTVSRSLTLNRDDQFDLPLFEHEHVHERAELSSAALQSEGASA